jgi:DNA repair protein RadC
VKRIKETPVWDRPREKLIKNGPSYLTNEELMAVVLGNGSRGHDVFRIAKRVLNYLQENLAAGLGCDQMFLKGFLQIGGLGYAKSALIVASLELFTRLTEEGNKAVKSAIDILPFVSYIAIKKQEYFVCVNLNGGNRVISNRVVTIGLVDQALVHPREVFSEALRERAAKVIVAHNHPAGGLLPSEEDVQITKNLVRAAGILGIAFLDHLIITEEGYYSFREEGLI